MNPELSHEELVSRTRAAIMQLQNMHRLVLIIIIIIIIIMQLQNMHRLLSSLSLRTFLKNIFQNPDTGDCQPEHTERGPTANHRL